VVSFRHDAETEVHQATEYYFSQSESPLGASLFHVSSLGRGLSLANLL